MGFYGFIWIILRHHRPWWWWGSYTVVVNWFKWIIEFLFYFVVSYEAYENILWWPLSRERRPELLAKWKTKGGILLIGYAAFRNLSLGKHVKDKNIALEMCNALQVTFLLFLCACACALEISLIKFSFLVRCLTVCLDFYITIFFFMWFACNNVTTWPKCKLTSLSQSLKNY